MKCHACERTLKPPFESLCGNCQGGIDQYMDGVDAEVMKVLAVIGSAREKRLRGVVYKGALSAAAFKNLVRDYNISKKGEGKYYIVL